MRISMGDSSHSQNQEKFIRTHTTILGHVSTSRYKFVYVWKLARLSRTPPNHISLPTAPDDMDEPLF
jgi:hypothetical protein